MTVRSLPQKRTRAPFELGCSPSPASITPASLFLSALIRTMNRMSTSVASVEELVAHLH
jgi:hypothetical protein